MSTLTLHSAPITFSIRRPEVIDRTAGATEVRHQEIQSSIRHSRKIQGGMMAGEQNLTRHFPESFLIDKPKDIVSGDFFWFKEVDGKIICAVGDSTGHGVPAAFMSILGISLLNQIIMEEKITDPSEILKMLSLGLRKSFTDYDPEKSYLNDGMDIAICCIDKNAGTVSFSGALRPAYIVSEKELFIINGSKDAITESNPEYTTHTYSYKNGDKLYLFTDGYADQFGGKKNKKLQLKRFKKILTDISHYSMATQMLKLERIFIEWKAEWEQTDDILVMGMELYTSTSLSVPHSSTSLSVRQKVC